MEGNGNDADYDDYDVKKYFSLQSRLHRVYLFTSNVELERTKRRTEQVFSIGERPPQTKDSLFLIKMMLST